MLHLVYTNDLGLGMEVARRLPSASEPTSTRPAPAPVPPDVPQIRVFAIPSARPTAHPVLAAGV